MGQWKAFGSGNKGLADVEPEEIGNIYDEANLGIPPKGAYLVSVKRLQGLESKGGDPMLKFVAEIAEPKGTKKAKYNGYGIWRYQVANEQWAGMVNSFLKAYFANETPAKQKQLITAFWDNKISVDDDDMITKIGTKLIKDGVVIGVTTKVEKSSEYDDKLAITGYMPASDAPKPVAADADDEELDDEEAAEDEADEEDADAPEMTEEEAERYEELQTLTLAKLKAAAKKSGVEEIPATKDEIIDAILDVEFGEEAEEDDEEAEDEPEEDEEPEGDEFDEMDRTALKKALKANGIELKVTTKTTDDEIREALRAEPEADEEEPEEEDEPEPEPTPARGRARAQAASPARPAARRRGAKASKDDEPPF